MNSILAAKCAKMAKELGYKEEDFRLRYLVPGQIGSAEIMELILRIYKKLKRR